MRVIPPPPLLPSPLAQPGGHALSTCLQLHASCLDGVSLILLLLVQYQMLWGMSCCLESSETNAIAPSLAVCLSLCALMSIQVSSHVDWPKYACRVAGSGAVGRMPTGTFRLAGSGAGASGGAALQRPVAPDLVANATSAAVAAASSAVDLSCMEIDVVAVGMGLRFVEIETNEKV